MYWYCLTLLTQSWTQNAAKTPYASYSEKLLLFSPFGPEVQEKMSATRRS